MPSRPLLFLYRLARVHQEDRSSDLSRSRPLLKDVLSKCTPKDVLSKCTPKNVLSKCTVKLVLQASSLLTSSHSGQACHVISCTSRAPSAPLVPLSCTALVHHSQASSTVVAFSAAWPSELLLMYHHTPLHNLVHHYVISCTIVHHSCSCTSPQSRAPLRNLVHLSCTIGSTRTTLVHCSRAPLTGFLNCRGTSHCLAVGSPHHSNTHNSHC